MESQKNPQYINISVVSVIKIILVFLIFYVLFLIRDILAILFAALILASAIDPWVDYLQQKKIPRGVSAISIYLLAALVIVGIIVLIIPPILGQVDELKSSFPVLIEKTVSGINVFDEFLREHGMMNDLKESLSDFGSLSGAASGVFSRLTGIVGSIFSFFLILVITFYMVVEEKAMKKIVFSFSPPKYQIYIMGLVNRMQQKIGLWLRGQLILSFIIFCLTYIGLSILGVEYALVLALVAGMTEFVPYLGPILASIPAIFLAFTQAPLLGVFVAILYYIIQLTENNIIAPKLMQKVVGLNPIVVIAVLLIGFELAGIIGAILSIPVATAFNVFLYDLFENKINTSERLEADE